MATYTSTQNGNWDAPATWGGGGWPQAAGDVVNIGHTVMYNVVSTVALGQINILSGGILSFSTAMSTKLTLGHQDIAISSGGELRVGGASAVIPKQYLAELIWNTTSDNAKGIYVNNGGKLSIYGDPDYYGAVDQDALAQDGDGGSYIYTVSDMSAKWVVGQEIIIHKNTLFANVNTDFLSITIASFAAGNKINVSAAVSSAFKAGGPIINPSRNVLLYKYGASLVLGQYNTNRPRLYDANGADKNSCIVREATVIGFYAIDSSYNFQFKGIIRNSAFAFFGDWGTRLNHTIQGQFFSLGSGGHVCSGSNITGNIFNSAYGITGSNNQFTGKMFGIGTYALYGENNTIIGDIYSCYYGGTGARNTIQGNLYYNAYGFGYSRIISSDLILQGNLGYDGAGNSKPNTIDVTCQPSMKVTFINSKLQPDHASRITGLTVLGVKTRLTYEHYNQVAGDHRVIDRFGNLVKTPADGIGDNPTQRSGGSADVLEITPAADCGYNTWLAYLDLLNLRLWAAAGVSKTYRFYLQTDFAALAKTALVLYGEYLDAASGGHLATVSSSGAGSFTARATASDWSQYVEVTINPAQHGFINLYLRLMAYESGKKVWVDPIPSGIAATPRWNYGEVVLEPERRNTPAYSGLIPLGVMEVVT